MPNFKEIDVPFLMVVLTKIYDFKKKLSSEASIVVLKDLYLSSASLDDVNTWTLIG